MVAALKASPGVVKTYQCLARDGISSVPDNHRRNAEDGQKGKQGGIFFDRNRLRRGYGEIQ